MRSRPTSRPSPKPAFPDSRSRRGTASSRRTASRGRQRPFSRPRSRRPWRRPPSARSSPTWARRPSAARRSNSARCSSAKTRSGRRPSRTRTSASSDDWAPAFAGATLTGTAMDIFSPEHYRATRLPLHRASPLPGWCYTSPEWHQREIETLFRRDWLCLGRAEQIPNPGDFFSIEVIGQPLIVVRDEQGQVRVHSAICRHRGAIIAEGKKGKCRGFVCPYHSWTYALDGKLISTPGHPPPMAGAEGFKPSEHGLNAVRSDIWGGFIFATFNEKAESLKEWLGDLP